MLWESSVITFVKDLRYRWCSRNVVPHFMNPPIGAERDDISVNSFYGHCFLFLPQLFNFAIISHACFLSQGHWVTSGVTEASCCKPHIFSPAVMQEAARDTRLILAGSDVLLWSTRTPHVEADMASHLQLGGLSTVWTLCRPKGACYLAVPERSLLFLFLYNVTSFLSVDLFINIQVRSLAHLKAEGKMFNRNVHYLKYPQRAF